LPLLKFQPSYVSETVVVCLTGTSYILICIRIGLIKLQKPPKKIAV